MTKFFGTDGIRGIVNKTLHPEIAFLCGNSLSRVGKKILIGGDTRASRGLLTLAFAYGSILNGSSITDVGVCTTSGIAYLTKTLGYDFGIVITASHNPSEYNGIKIFDKNGLKISEKIENQIEKGFEKITVNRKTIGNYIYNKNLVKKYTHHLIDIGENFSNIKIVLDASNGASKDIAKKVFKKLGADVILVKTKTNEINKNCGALHPEVLRDYVLKNNAYCGFSFDGDADRIVACLNSGRLLDGDEILYILANELQSKNQLNFNTIVGTEYTNLGIEKELLKNGIKLIRTKTGDKYISQEIENKNLSLGGEQSGHVIIRKHTTTGDGIITALTLLKIFKQQKFETILPISAYYQEKFNQPITNKNDINTKLLEQKIKEFMASLGSEYRIMYRFSGTEPLIRFLIEGKDYAKVKQTKLELQKYIKKTLV